MNERMGEELFWENMEYGIRMRFSFSLSLSLYPITSSRYEREKIHREPCRIQLIVTKLEEWKLRRKKGGFVFNHTFCSCTTNLITLCPHHQKVSGKKFHSLLKLLSNLLIYTLINKFLALKSFAILVIQLPKCKEIESEKKELEEKIQFFHRWGLFPSNGFNQLLIYVTSSQSNLKWFFLNDSQLVFDENQLELFSAERNTVHISKGWFFPNHNFLIKSKGG